MLIGIYRGSIIIKKPTESGLDSSAGLLPLSLWLPFKADELGEGAAEIEIAPPGGDKLRIKLKVKIDNPSSFSEITSFQLKNLPLVFKNAGDLRVLFRNEGDEEWEILRVTPVAFS